MSIRIADYFNGPALFVVWLLDVYVVLVVFRATVGQLPVIAHSLFGRGIRRLTDTFPQAICRKLKQPINNPTWLPWLVVMVTAILIRYLTIYLIVDGYTPL